MQGYNLKIQVPECILTQNSVGEGSVSYTGAREKRVPECHSGLCTSEKQLPEWHSGTFHHKYYPCVGIAGNNTYFKLHTPALYEHIDNK
jgi:hypothetical protein